MDGFYDVLAASGCREFDVFTTTSESPVIHVDIANRQAEDVADIIHQQEYDFTGIVFAPSDLSWCAAQYFPVDWGVFAFNSGNEQALSLFNLIDKGWFASIEQLQQALKNEDSFLYEEFGAEGIELMLRHYAK